MPVAPAPARSTGTLDLYTSGIVIPCSVFSGIEDTAVRRSEYLPVPTPDDGVEFVKVGRAKIRKDSGKLVNPANVVKMVETDRGLVELTDDEIAIAVGCENGTASIERFLPLSVMASGAYLPDSLYQIRPSATNRRGQPRPSGNAVEQAFSLLISAMRVESVFALLRVALRGKPRYAALMPDGRLMTLRYDTEIRADLPMPDFVPTDADLMTMRMLVAAKTTNVAAPLIDNAGDALREFVQSKATGTLPDVPAPLPPVNNVETLMESLREAVRGLGLSPVPAVRPSPASDVWGSPEPFEVSDDEGATFTVDVTWDDDDDDSPLPLPPIEAVDPFATTPMPEIRVRPRRRPSAFNGLIQGTIGSPASAEPIYTTPSFDNGIRVDAAEAYTTSPVVASDEALSALRERLTSAATPSERLAAALDVTTALESIAQEVTASSSADF